jgi:hypothetical protein
MGFEITLRKKFSYVLTLSKTKKRDFIHLFSKRVSDLLLHSLV